MTPWMFVIVVCSTVFGLIASTLHFALRDFSVLKLEEIAGRNGGFERLKGIVDESEAYALSIGALRSIFVASMVVGVTLLLPLRGADQAEMVAWFVTALIIGTVLVYIIAVVVPASIADHAGEWLIHRLQLPLKAVHVLLYPLRSLVVLDTAVRFIAGTHRVTEAEELQDEILSAASEGERDGSLGEGERRMIEAVLNLSNKATSEIMTPRTEMESLPSTATLEDVKHFIETAGHSRIPVYENDQDHILGILYAKDLLTHLGSGSETFDIRTNLREALFVPENKPAAELLVELRTKNIHFAIVLDEYGGTTGLVTLEDILEEIVGDIRDEYEPEHEREPIILVNEEERTAEIEARAYISDANRALEPIDIELPESDHYDTVGGFALSELGHFPDAGESFRNNGFLITILEAEATRILRLRIETAAEHEEESQETPSGEASREPTEATADPAEG